ncbi:/ lgt / Prolipoprotein diacylglyceryl transferase /:472470 Reverse [Candidatus Hepatoplasma crinochetorum]|uniref:Phosphatidylglycerol--prolipoprotein diacylglyceryl transferase n=1 Tax=Candidatus Hepatoplasma crinochetorum TaxID=295596 RepID=A0A0G7ZMX6_9MOLU|nr:/ lgt / Prolipoprotein diacylglyceryl transferase /:472470 Reverse [Candidatus Hepatoplasma crinochetorum]
MITEVNSDFAIAFWIGPIPIPWYGLMLLLGFIFVFLISYIEWKKKKYKTFDLFLLFFVGVIVAIFGARWWYLLFNPKDFNGFISLFQIGEGRSILGSIFAILIWLYIYTTYFASYIEFRISFSIIVPNILIGQAIGRWGNFFDQNVYGQIATNELAFLPDFISDHMFIDGYYRQPLFLYESILDFLGWIIIALFLKTSTKIKAGVHGGFYLFWYGTVRVSMELLRDDKYIMKIGDVPTSFILSFFFLFYGIILMIYYQYYFERIAIFNHTYGKFYYEIKRKNFKLWTMYIFNYKYNKKYKNLINQNNLNYNNFKKFYPQNEYFDVVKKYKKDY